MAHCRDNCSTNFQALGLLGGRCAESTTATHSASHPFRVNSPSQWIKYTLDLCAWNQDPKLTCPLEDQPKITTAEVFRGSTIIPLTPALQPHQQHFPNTGLRRNASEPKIANSAWGFWLGQCVHSKEQTALSASLHTGISTHQDKNT